MNLLDTYLEKALASGFFVDVYRDYHDDGAIFCLIKAVTEDCVLTQRFDEQGEYDGLMIFPTESITRFRWGGNDRQAQQRLAEKNARIPELPAIDLTSTAASLRSLNTIFGYVTVNAAQMARHELYIGEVVAVDDEYVVLNEYGTRHTLDRSMLVLKLEEITSLQADSKYERELLYLHQTRQLH
ncbi:MAG: hypothetical protein K1Y36_27590 [Blastocatellia bacterium]|nr:hypothetical protein [Blastocatellia bacterium]